MTALVTRLDSQTSHDSYTVVPQGTAAPYVQLSLPTARRADTYGRFGAWVTVDVDSITAGPSQQAGLRMREDTIEALNDQRLTLAGHTMIGSAWETNEGFPEVIQGQQYHHHVATFSVWTEQSTS